MDIYEQTWFEVIKTHVEKRIKTIESGVKPQDFRDWIYDYHEAIDTYGLQRKSALGDKFDMTKWYKYLDYAWWSKDVIDDAHAAYNTLWEIILRSTFTSHAQFESVVLKWFLKALSQLEQTILTPDQFKIETRYIVEYCVRESNLWGDNHPDEYRANMSKFP